MTTLKLSPAALLSLLQHCDTLFPNGAFSHSFGLEAAVQSGKVLRGDDLVLWMRAKLTHQIYSCDLPLCARSHTAGKREDKTALKDLDAEGHAMRLPREIREGGRMIASRLIQSAASNYPCAWTRHCEKSFKTGELKGDPAVAFGIYSVGAGIPIEAALYAYLYIFISGQVSAALRLISMGQTEGQAIIKTLSEWAEKNMKLDALVHQHEKPLSAFMPAADIRAMQHENSPTRLFQS